MASMSSTGYQWALAVSLFVACGGTTVVEPAGGTGGSGATGSGGMGAGASGAGAAGAGTTSTTSSSGGGTCGFIQPDVYQLCVRGQPGPSGGEIISISSPPTFELFAGGCFSSSCSVVHAASCEVAGFSDPELFLDADFCVEDTSNQGQPCTDDCMQVGAECEAMVLLDGGYSATYGELTVLFTVPMQLPSGGQCVSVDF
jgi:hypothetical protein